MQHAVYLSNDGPLDRDLFLSPLCPGSIMGCVGPWLAFMGYNTTACYVSRELAQKSVKIGTNSDRDLGTPGIQVGLLPPCWHSL